MAISCKSTMEDAGVKRKAIFRVGDSNEWSRRKFRNGAAYLYAMGVWDDSDLINSAKRSLIVLVIYGLRALHGF